MVRDYFSRLYYKHWHARTEQAGGPARHSRGALAAPTGTDRSPPDRAIRSAAGRDRASSHAAGDVRPRVARLTIPSQKPRPADSTEISRESPSTRNSLSRPGVPQEPWCGQGALFCFRSVNVTAKADACGGCASASTPAWKRRGGGDQRQTCGKEARPGGVALAEGPQPGRSRAASPLPSQSVPPLPTRACLRPSRGRVGVARALRGRRQAGGCRPRGACRAGAPLSPRLALRPALGPRPAPRLESRPCPAPTPRESGPSGQAR